MPTKYHCVDFWKLDPQALSLPYEARKRFIEHVTSTVDSPDGFPDGSFSVVAAMLWHEEALVVFFFVTLMAGPILNAIVLVYALCFGTWVCLFTVISLTAFMSLHPLPENPVFAKTYFTVYLWKYFTYRMVYCDDDLQKLEDATPWVAVAPPHGVAPIGNMLAYSASNCLLKRPFVGSAASIVLYTPFLRYGSLFFGSIDVSAKSIARTCQSGKTVGVVADGIAGIFAVDHTKEVVAMQDRKGLAKLSLRSGLPLLPCYSLGNTMCFSIWADQFGILKRLSRVLRTSIFVFWGRWGLPIPRRVNMTFAFSEPVGGQQQLEPSPIDIDSLHALVLTAVRANFDSHKRAYGWQEKRLSFV